MLNWLLPNVMAAPDAATRLLALVPAVMNKVLELTCNEPALRNKVVILEFLPTLAMLKVPAVILRLPLQRMLLTELDVAEVTLIPVKPITASSPAPGTPGALFASRQLAALLKSP